MIPHHTHFPVLLGLAACLLVAARPSWGDETGAATVASDVPPECTRAVVYLYHSFDRGSGELSADSATLDAHLTWLEQNHVALVSMDQFVGFLDGRVRLPSRAALLTIDDGDATVYTRAWPVLRRHQAPFVLGLPTKLMEAGPRGMLTWAQVTEMVSSGLAEVASHGHEHRGLTHYQRARAAQELATSRRIILERTGRVPTAFFYPLGAIDDRAAGYVRDAGFAAAFTAQAAPMVPSSAERYRIPRATVMHRHTLRALAWFFGPKFWQRSEATRAACPER